MQADGYKNTGCYNLLCPGFVQTNKNVVIGGTITPTSTYNGGQFEITLLIWKDQDNGNWWFGYGTEIVGYWPSSLFTQFNDNAHAIQFMYLFASTVVHLRVHNFLKQIFTF